MTDISEAYIRENCPFCDREHIAFRFLLEETDEFYIACDYNPLIEGHLLIIPKRHLPCVGEYPDDVYAKFKELYERCSRFLMEAYGSAASFEHGRLGQSVFHSHIHLLPFSGTADDIIPEGSGHREEVAGIDDVRGKSEYLYFSIGEKAWLADSALAVSRFFRTRFATAFGAPERADWKETQTDPLMRAVMDPECLRLTEKWKQNRAGV